MIVIKEYNVQNVQTLWLIFRSSISSDRWVIEPLKDQIAKRIISAICTVCVYVCVCIIIMKKRPCAKKKKNNNIK